MTNIKKYSATDFEKYYSGLMSSADMNALEKAALEDDFLNDALEGFQYSQKPQEEVSAILERIATRSAVKQRSAPSSNMMWRVAAAIILMGGLGYFVYQQNNVNEKATLANADLTPPQNAEIKATEAYPSDNSPSAEVNSNEATINNLPQKTPIVTTENNKPILSPVISNKEVKKEAIVSASEDRVVNEVSADKAMHYNAAPVIQDEKYADVAQTEKVKDDQRGKEKKNAKQSAVSKSEGAARREVAAPPILIDRDKSAIAEMVNGNAIPVSGWAAFDNYVNLKALKSYDESGKRIIKTTILSFQLDDNRNPILVTAENQLEFQNKNNVVDLLIKSGKWLGEVGITYRIKLTF